MDSPVQVWHIPLQVSSALSAQLLASYFECLSLDERQKADRFRLPADRRRFVMARGTLRYLLGRQLNRSPKSVAFCYGAYGKPAVETANLVAENSVSAPGGGAETSAENRCNVHFNLSHSSEMALCALGYERRVGIDIERVKPMKRLDGMMKRTLIESEQREVEAEPPAAQAQAFLQRWTCKEAYLKAIGLGLTQSMQTVEVQLSPPKLLQVPESCSLGWHLNLVTLTESYVGALVTEGKTPVAQRQWQHDI